MLNLVKNGILSFHTADTNQYKGRPSGFYEYLNNENLEELHCNDFQLK